MFSGCFIGGGDGDGEGLILTNLFPKHSSNSFVNFWSGISFSSSLSILRAPKYSLGLYIPDASGLLGVREVIILLASESLLAFYRLI